MKKDLLCKLLRRLGVIEDLNLQCVPDQCLILGYIAVNANGTVAAQCGGGSVQRIAVGRYNVTPPAGAEVVFVQGIDPAGQRDDINTSLSNFVGGTLVLGDGDNGAAASVVEDYPFNIVWYGKGNRVTC